MTNQPWEWQHDSVSWLWILSDAPLADHLDRIVGSVGDFADVSVAEVELAEHEEEVSYALPGQLDALRSRLESNERVQHVYLPLTLRCLDESGAEFVIEDGARMTLVAQDPSRTRTQRLGLQIDVDVYDPDGRFDIDEQLAIANGPRLTSFLERLTAYALRLHSVEKANCPNAHELGIHIPDDD